LEEPVDEELAVIFSAGFKGEVDGFVGEVGGGFEFEEFVEGGVVGHG
jgi:hypothetical protein